MDIINKLKNEGVEFIHLSIINKPGLTVDAVLAELAQAEISIKDGGAEAPVPTTFPPQKILDIIGLDKLKG